MTRRRVCTARCLLVVALVTLVACGGARAPSNDVDATEVRTPKSVTATDAWIEARSIATRPSDLPTGWVECCPPFTYDAEGLRTHTCAAPSTLPPRTAGVELQYALNLRNQREDGHLVSSVFVAATADDARAELAGIDSPAYQQCMQDDVFAEIDKGMPGRTHPPAIAIARTPVHGARGMHDRYTVTTDETLPIRTMYVDIVRLQLGRVLVRETITMVNTPMDDGTLDHLAERMLERATTSRVGGSLD